MPVEPLPLFLSLLVFWASGVWLLILGRGVDDCASQVFFVLVLLPPASVVLCVIVCGLVEGSMLSGVIWLA